MRSRTKAILTVDFEDAFQTTVDLGINCESLPCCLWHILVYFFSGSLVSHRFREIMDLLQASGKCPPDVSVLLVAIAAALHAHGVELRATVCRLLWRRLLRILRERPLLKSFGDDQDVGYRHTRRLAFFFFMFTHRCTSLPDVAGDHYGIDYILKYVQRYRRVELALPAFGPCGEGDFDFDHDIEIDPVTEALAALFVDWNSAYDAVKAVGGAIRDGQNVNVELLLRVISPTFTHFVREGIQFVACPL
jgi:hypothetical protein